MYFNNSNFKKANSWPYNPIDITITRALKMPRVNVHTKFDGGVVNKVLVCSLENNVTSYI